MSKTLLQVDEEMLKSRKALVGGTLLGPPLPLDEASARPIHSLPVSSALFAAA